MGDKRLTCTTCKIEKPIEDFQRNAAMRLGRSYTCKECVRIYAKGKRTAMKAAEYLRRDMEKNELAYKARWKIATAIRWGRMQKEPCWYCGVKKVEAHHLLYEFPLKVIWLCKQHHADTHRR